MIRGLYRFALCALLATLPGAVLAQDGPEVFRNRTMPYDAFDRLLATKIAVANAQFVIGFAPGELTLPRSAIVEWVADSAGTVSAYYGRFPVDHVRVLIVPGDGDKVRSGTAFAHRGAALRIVVGRDATRASLAGDWIIVHELTHLAFPDVARPHHWIEEGLASYIEPIARAQLGKFDAADVWRQFVAGMPKGLPAAGDRGLDQTPTWGRTYWGGALFCLLADVEIRERTHNRFGLQDALRAIVSAGGNMESHWPVTRAFEVGDAAVGVPVLMGLYERMKATPEDVDLARLWRRLGVGVAGNTVVFDDSAPLASVRQAITRSPAVVRTRAAYPGGDTAAR
ncbi:MAG: hypothetical protein ABIR52_01830 [Casimicrobiaceae bacterium]